MSETNLEIGPFYENKGDLTYVCDLTGQVCNCVTKHFREYRDFVARLSEHDDGSLFLTSEPNLCTQMRCSVYENEWIRQAELRTQKQEQEKLAKIDQQVADFEKSLPGYLEQKQLVEQYRESLMRGERQ